MQHPTKPDAFALAACTDTVHAVVPIAAADQRQTVAADRQAGVQGAGAMLVEAGGLVRGGRQEETVALAGLELRAGEKGRRLVEHGGVAGDLDVVRGRVGEPDAIVRYARANPLAGVRQPPVLDVTLDELAARRFQQVLSRHGWPDRRQGHAVLQLISEAVGAAGLVKPRASPDAAGERLIGQPAIEHNVH